MEAIIVIITKMYKRSKYGKLAAMLQLNKYYELKLWEDQIDHMNLKNPNIGYHKRK